MADKGPFEFLIYNSVEENVSVNAVVHDETIWLTQKAMAELFDIGIPSISKHLKKYMGQSHFLWDRKNQQS